MKQIWMVMRLELTLILRGKAIWIVGIVVALIGLWAATGIREMPDAAWTNFGITPAFLISLILAFSTGDQAHRDRERHLDGVLLSTPVSTTSYVVGKYLAALLTLLGLVGIGLVAAIVTDQFYHWQSPPVALGYALYPPLGAWAYVVIWCWLLVVPVIFGAAVVYAGITITRGQRMVAYAGILVLWMTSLLFDQMPDLIDLSTFSINNRYAPAPSAAFLLEGSFGRFNPPDTKTANGVIHLVQASIPPPYLPISFLWNRLFFLGLAVLLLLLTVRSVRRQRQGLV